MFSECNEGALKTLIVIMAVIGPVVCSTQDSKIGSADQLSAKQKRQILKMNIDTDNSVAQMKFNVYWRWTYAVYGEVRHEGNVPLLDSLSKFDRAKIVRLHKNIDDMIDSVNVVCDPVCYTFF